VLTISFQLLFISVILRYQPWRLTSRRGDEMLDLETTTLREGETMAPNEVQATAMRAARPADSDVQEAAPVAPPCVMVIFGAAGDLTKRLVVPALYNLVNDKRLSENFQIVGVDLAAKTAEEWRQSLTDMMNEFVTKGGGEFEADHIDQDA